MRMANGHDAHGAFAPFTWCMCAMYMVHAHETKRGPLFAHLANNSLLNPSIDFDSRAHIMKFALNTHRPDLWRVQNENAEGKLNYKTLHLMVSVILEHHGLHARDHDAPEISIKGT